MIRAISLALLICACGTRTGLDDFREDGTEDARVRDASRDTRIRDTRPRDVAPVDVGVPDCPCTGAAVLASDTTAPGSIAIDRDYVYWANAGSDCTNGSVSRVLKCGGPIEVLVSGESTPRRLALDEERVYFYDGCGSGRLQSVPKAGGPTQEYMISVSDSGRAIAVGGDSIYFSDYGLLRIPKAGGTQTVIEDAHFVYAVAADDRGVYWSGPLRASSTFRVFAYHPGDTGATMLATVSSAGNHLTIDDETIYFSANSGIARMPRAGGDVTMLVASTSSWRIAVDDRFVYWTVGFSGSGGYTINKVRKSGGEPTVIGEGDGAYVDLAVDDNCVYVADLYSHEIRSFPNP